MSCHTGTYPLRPSLLASLSELSFGFGPLDQVIHHLVNSVRVRGCTYINQSSSYHFVVCLSFSGPHLYRSVIFRVNLCFQCHTYIDRPSSYHFLVCLSFLGSYLYRSVIHPISFNLVWVGAALISIGHVPITFHVQFESGPHLYRSVIVLSVRVQGRTYIDQSSPYHVSSVSGTAPISTVIVLSIRVRVRTYIDRSSHCLISLVSRTAPISISHCFIS